MPRPERTLFDWLLALAGVEVSLAPRTAVAELELSRLPPGGLVTAWVGDVD